MEKRNVLRLAMAACAVLSMAVVTAQAQGPNWARGKVAVLSASRPTDSRGETVYEARKQGDDDQLAVAGAFTPPVPVKRNIFPEYPESMRRAKEDGAVVVEGIVAEDGKFIDLKVFRTSDPAFNKNAMKAAADYAFQPATLDGKPVACLLRVEMTFNIYR